MKIRLDVGEPRGFDAGDNTGSIVCTVVEGLSGEREIEEPVSLARQFQAAGSKGETVQKEKDKEYWFVANCPEVVFNDIRFRSLLLTPRYRVKRPPADILASGEELVLNGIWRQDGGVWDRESIEAAREGNLEVEGIVVARAKLLSE